MSALEDIVEGVNFILTEPYGSVAREFIGNKVKFPFYTLEMPLDKYKKFLDNIYAEGKDCKWTPIRLWDNSGEKLLWEADMYSYLIGREYVGLEEFIRDLAVKEGLKNVRVMFPESSDDVENNTLVVYLDTSYKIVNIRLNQGE